MSHFTTVETQFNDQEVLVRALQKMPGIGGKLIDTTHITVQPDQTLIGYDGGDRTLNGRTVTADIRIHRRALGNTSNDIGFKKQTDGTYQAIISEYDTKSAGYGKKWVQELKRVYAQEKVCKSLEQQGYSYTITKDQQKNTIQIKARSFR